MSVIDFALWLSGSLLAVWLFGGYIARIGGLLFVLAGAVNLALDPQAGALLLVAMGALMWLAGHWHYALRHHEYKSPLADYVFLRWAPEWLDPSRGWAVAVERAERVEGEPSNEGRGPA